MSEHSSPVHATAPIRLDARTAPALDASIVGGAVRAIRHSKEEFGYLVIFADGSIDLYAASVRDALSRGPTKEELQPNRLQRLTIGPTFHLNSPLIVWFEVTRKCNLTCTHCYINAGRARAGELRFEEITALLDDLKKLGVFSLVLAGGEPYTRRDFPDILNYALHSARTGVDTEPFLDHRFHPRQS